MADTKELKSASAKNRNSRGSLSAEREKYAPSRIEEELEDLHKKYRLSEENDRTGIQKPRSERNEVQTAESMVQEGAEIAEMSTTMTMAYRKKVSSVEALAKLQEQANMYLKKIEHEKKLIKDVDAETEKVQAEVLQQRKTLGGVKVAEQKNLVKQNRIKTLENKMEKTRVKYNEAVAYNKSLREQVDNLRRERVVFDGVYRRLEKELADKKTEMNKLVEVSAAAYEARERAQQELEALRSQAQQEQRVFEAEWQELGQLIENDAKMKEYMKQREKALKEGVDLEDEEKLRKKIIKSNPNIAKDKALQQQSLHRVQAYEEAFAKIQAATGLSDIDELVATFIEAEDQNFSLFNYVNELNSEVEKLEEQISELRKEIEKHRGQALSTDSQRRLVLQELEDKLAKSEAKAEEYEHKAGRAMKTIHILKDGIQDIFEKIGCNQSSVTEMLGSTGVTEANMMQYLGIIEQRTNEILQMYAAVQMQQQGVPLKDSLVSILGKGPELQPGASKLSVAAPSLHQQSDSEDPSDNEDDRPLSRDELRQKALLRVQKTEASAQGQGSTGEGGGARKDKGKAAGKDRRRGHPRFS